MPRDLLDRLSLEERYPFLKKSDNSSDKANGSDRSDKSDKKIKTTKKPEDLLRQGTRALIVGTPGAGKSVLMRYLALQALLHKIHKDYLPIFIELKSISQSKFTELKEDFENLLLENIINKAKGEFDDNAAIDKYLKQQLKLGKVSIFLDGLDEIKAEPFFNKLCDSINMFLRATNSNNSLIISSRPYAVTTKFYSIKEMEIAPLNHKQIEKFVNCYYPNESKQFIKRLERKEQKELTRVPLLLSILISLYYRGETVNNRLDLYKLITNHLVTVIDEAKNITLKFKVDDPGCKLKLELLKTLAYGKLFNNKIEDNAQRFVFSDDEILKQAKLICLNFREACLLAEDIKSIAIVREIANQTYAFTHLTIQEYLAAIFLSEKENSEQLICQNYFDKTIVQLEVLPMAIGLSKNISDIYEKLRGLPESLDYINFRLRIKGFTHITQLHQHSIHHEIEVLSNQLIDLIKGIISSQIPYINDILSAFSSCNFFYLDMFASVLYPLLADSDSKVRSRAAEALGEMGTEEAVDSLCKALFDSDWIVRSNAAEALGKIGNDKAVKPLIKALADSQYHVRSNAAETLGKIGSDKAVNSLIKALADSDSKVRSSAAEALGKIGTDKAVNSLIKVLADSDSKVRSSATEALGKIGTEEVVEPLIKALADSDIYVCSNAAEALGKIGTDKAVNSLVKALSNSDSKVRSSAAEALGKIGTEEVVEPLIKALADSDSKVCSNAAKALAEIGTEEVVEPLIKVLAHSDNSVYSNAAKALAEIGTDKAVDSLIKYASAHFSSVVRSKTVYALREIGTDEAVDSLINCLLSSNDSKVRTRIAEALAEIETDKAVDSLIKYASAHFSSVARSRIAEALEKIGSEEAVEPLIKALSYSNSSSSVAAEALKEIKEKLGKRKRNLFGQSLINTVKSTNIVTRKKAIEVAGYYTMEKEFISLLSQVINEEPDKEVKEIAVLALSLYKNKLKLFSIL